MDIRIEFTDKEITPWGGMVLMKQLIDRSGINGALQEVGLPEQRSNRGYSPIQLINNFWVSVWSGANRFEHLEVTRQDKVIQNIFGWKRMAGHKAFQRYFKKFNQETNDVVFKKIFQWFFGELKFDRYTLDLDSTVMTRYGEQEGARRGYNPKKRGRSSHHPLMAFIAELRMAVNFWLRPGDTSSSNNFCNFLIDTLERLKGKRIGLLRADSGFFSSKILSFLEKREEPIDYIISARLYSGVKRILTSQRTWIRLDDGIEIAEAMYRSLEWEKERRMVIVRQHIDIRPKATGRQLRLIEDESFYRNYRYSIMVTNLTLPVELVWKLYRERADAENRIKELKEDFGAESFNIHEFFATEAALNFVILAYNLVSLFRQVVLGTATQHQMKTLRYKIFASGGYIVHQGNARILKLSMAMKRRKWFMGLFSKVNLFTWPVLQQT
ncbi:MAG: IS1380 family transposase [Bacteroidota bacterium]